MTRSMRTGSHSGMRNSSIRSYAYVMMLAAWGKHTIPILLVSPRCIIDTSRRTIPRSRAAVSELRVRASAVQHQTRSRDFIYAVRVKIVSVAVRGKVILRAGEAAVEVVRKGRSWRVARRPAGEKREGEGLVHVGSKSLSATKIRSARQHVVVGDAMMYVSGGLIRLDRTKLGFAG